MPRVLPMCMLLAGCPAEDPKPAGHGAHDTMAPTDDEPPPDSDDTPEATATPPGPTGDTGHTGHTGLQGESLPDTGVEETAADTGQVRQIDTGFDCSELPQVPATFTELTGYGNGEDFDFDGLGRHVSIVGGNLVGRDRFGNVTVLAAGFAGSTTGTRVLTSGEIVVANSDFGSLTRVDPSNGAQTPIMGGLSFPNGVEVDADDHVYVAENGAHRIQRVHAYTLDTLVVAVDVRDPNGIIMSPDGQTLYVGTCPVDTWGGVARVYAIDRLGPNLWDVPRVLYEDPGSSCWDGMNVDACGNVYTTDYVGGSSMLRITPDGLVVQEVVALPAFWTSNMRWGHEIGGWRRDILYQNDRVTGKIFEIDVGMLGKKHILMP